MEGCTHPNDKTYTEAKHLNCFPLKKKKKKKDPLMYSKEPRGEKKAVFLNKIWNLPFEPI